jgi:hypothetical protein
MRIEIRTIEPQDKPFIFSTWLKNYKATSTFAKRIPNDIYFKNHHAIIEHIMNKPDAVVLIAHSSGDSDQILGYLVYEDAPDGHLIHYAFTRDTFKAHGVARALFLYADIDPMRLTFTHFTYDVNDLQQKGKIEGRYDPYRI